MAGIAFKAGILWLGKSVLDFQRDAVAKKKKQERDAKLKAYQEY